jgi:protein-S-isoprenylcysteine O-methyltransferase Ste14
MIFVLSAIDHRFSWSVVPLFLVVAGDVLVALGLLIVFWVFKENSFASATIEVGMEQTLVSTGPYALVRHPMYFGAFIMLTGVPLALGSWWGLLTVIPIMVIIVWRLLNEEIFLEKELPGYSAYRKKVRYRLLPLIW